MSALQGALRQRQRQKDALVRQQRVARATCGELRRQYRARPVLPLGVAVLAGYTLARVRPDWRPPRAWMRHAWRWSMLLLRTML